MKCPFFPLVVCASLFSASIMGGEHWPQFRGPNGDGISDAKGLPLKWGEAENVKWKSPIHGRAWSSPVIWGKQLWVTTATEDGKELFAFCVDRDSGKITADMKVFDVAAPQYAHKFNTYASPTPVIEAGRVYVTFGAAGTACIDTQSFKVLWTRPDLECNHYRGPGSSPVLYGGLLLMHFDGSDHQFVIALDKATGKTVWRRDRSIDYQDLGPDGKPNREGDMRKAFSTPLVATFDGQPLLISLGGKAAYGYNPLTGEEYWRLEERANHSASTRPIVGHGLIFYPTGLAQGYLFAVRPGGHGGIPRTHVAWKVKRNVPNKPSVLLVNDLIYMIDDGGVASCLAAKTGEQVWNERVGGNYSASPVYVDGHIWFFSEEGKTTAIKAGRDFKIVAENHLDDGFMASAALSGKAFYLRTKTHLYRIEK